MKDTLDGSAIAYPQSSIYIILQELIISICWVVIVREVHAQMVELIIKDQTISARCHGAMFDVVQKYEWIIEHVGVYMEVIERQQPR